MCLSILTWKMFRNFLLISKGKCRVQTKRWADTKTYVFMTEQILMSLLGSYVGLCICSIRMNIFSIMWYEFDYIRYFVLYCFERTKTPYLVCVLLQNWEGRNCQYA